MRTSVDSTTEQSVDAVWASLMDIDGVLAMLPGAALVRDRDAVSGSLKCKFATTQVTYRIRVHAEVGQPEFHSAVLRLTGKEARGSGTVNATVTVALRSEPPATRLELHGDIEATGRAENVDERDWARVLQSLLDSVTQRPATGQPGLTAATPASAPLPPLTVAPSPRPPGPDAAQGPDRRRQVGLGLAAVGLLLLLRAIRRRRRG